MLLSAIAFMNDVVKKKRGQKDMRKEWRGIIAYQQASGRLSLEYQGWLVNKA